MRYVFTFFTSSPILITCLFDKSLYQLWGDISLWFWSAFPWCLMMLNIFPCTYWSFVCCMSFESWAPKNWCFWTVVLEKTLESPLDCKELQLVHSEGDQSWVFIGRTDAKAETPILWPSHAKSWLIGKDSDAGRDWGQEEKGMTEDEMAGWHYWLNGRESEWTLGVSDGQGGLACCYSWVAKSWTRLSYWIELKYFTSTFHFYALEREMATHSSVLTWRVPGMVEPGGLPSMGPHRVGHDWSNSSSSIVYLKLLKEEILKIFHHKKKVL